MDHFDYSNPSFVSHLNPIEGIQFDGRAYALYGMKLVDLHEFYICSFLDPNFKIHDTLTVNFQIQTFAHDGLILWISDSLPESSFTIEIQNRQVRYIYIH
jgi:hypothetical protein